MKKVLTATKSSSPSKFVRRVLSKTSNEYSNDSVANNSEECCDPNEENIDDQQQLKQELEQNRQEQDEEIQYLTKRICELERNIKQLEKNSDLKERAFVSLSRDKDRLLSELGKQKRSNACLRQQLDEERSYYMKEKQHYCREINESKRNKRRANPKIIEEYDQTVEKLKQENEKLKSQLDGVMGKNHNLCVKFLRMKNTKDDLKAQFQRYQTDNTRLIEDIMSQFDATKASLNAVIDEQLEYPLSVSNRKYLDIIRRNSQLIHENLCLKIQLENSLYEMEKFRCSYKRQVLKKKYQLRKPKIDVNDSNKTEDLGKINLDQTSEIKVQNKTSNAPTTDSGIASAVCNNESILKVLDDADSEQGNNEQIGSKQSENNSSTVSSYSESIPQSTDGLDVNSAPEILESKAFSKFVNTT